MYTTEGALGEILLMLQRMRELAVQATDDTLASRDRDYIQQEIDKLKEEINRIAGTMDADMAEEALELTKAGILVYSGVAVISQANLRPQAVLSLLK